MTEPRRWRVHHYSPWGTDASGITNYCRLLLPELARHVDVTVVHPDATDPQFRVRRPVDVRLPTIDGADLSVFHIGNNVAFHHWMLGPLYQHGGVVVLHDWSLYDLMRPLFFRARHLWERELAFNHVDEQTMLRRLRDPEFRMEFPLNRRVLEAADLVVVHTEWVRDHAREHYPDLDIRYVPLACPDLPAQPIPAHAAITVLGGIGAHKRIEWALEAFARVAHSHPEARLRIVGRGDDRQELQRLRQLADQLAIAGRVEWHLDVDRATYLRLLGESLVVVTLRAATAGEMSGVLVEAWGAGRVAITSDQPQFRAFDERYCRRIPLGLDAVTELARTLGAALDDPGAMARDGDAGRALAQGAASFTQVAHQHATIIDEVARRRTHEPFAGLDVHGSWGTPSGLVEVARRLVVALDNHRVPVTLPRELKLPGYDPALVPPRFAALPTTPQYAINLVTANVNEFHLVNGRILGTRQDRRWNIGLWIFEFAELGAALRDRCQSLDEIWTGSTFAARTFERYFDGPIVRLHNIVVPRPRTLSPTAARARFGLRDDATVVLFSFDFASGWGRKNPLAVIRAFRDARDAVPGARAQLVIKSSGLREPYRTQLNDLLKTTDGVHLDTFLSDEDLGDLFHTADVYCSLHRTEGFGLGMAEAMAIGKTVIGTRYSGNLDFMDDANSLLVDCTMGQMTVADADANPGLERLVKVGSAWAEPDHASAVAALIRSFDPAVRDRLGPRARADIERDFSATAAMAIIDERLGVLRSELEGRRSEWPRVAR